MNFGGLNTRAGSVDLGPGESPALTNAFFHEGRLGIIGPRPGRKVVNAAAYSEDVMGRAKYLRPGGTYRQIVALNNGDAIEGDQSGQSAPTLYLTGSTATALAQNTGITLTYPSTLATQLTTFSNASTYDPDASLLISWEVTLGLTGAGDWTSSNQLAIRFGVNMNGVGKVLQTFLYTANFSQSFSLGIGDIGPIAIPTSMHAATDTITGGYFEIEWTAGAWPTGVGAGDNISLSSILIG